MAAADIIQSRFRDDFIASDYSNAAVAEEIREMLKTFWNDVFEMFKHILVPDMASISKICEYDYVDITTASKRITYMYKNLLADSLFRTTRNIDFELQYRKLSELLESSPYESVLEYVIDTFEDGMMDHSLVKYFIEEKESVLTYFCYVKALMSVRDCALIDYFRGKDSYYQDNMTLAIVELYKCLDLEEYIFKLDNVLKTRELTISTTLDFFFYFREKYFDDLKSGDDDLTSFQVLFTFRLSIGGDLGVVPVYLVC
jgi:hypothetical protein